MGGDRGQAARAQGSTQGLRPCRPCMCVGMRSDVLGPTFRSCFLTCMCFAARKPSCQWRSPLAEDVYGTRLFLVSFGDCQAKLRVGLLAHLSRLRLCTGTGDCAAAAGAPVFDSVSPKDPSRSPGCIG